MSSSGIRSSAVQLSNHQCSRQPTVKFNLQFKSLLAYRSFKQLKGVLFVCLLCQCFVFLCTLGNPSSWELSCWHHFIGSPGKLKYYQNSDYIRAAYIKKFHRNKSYPPLINNTGKLLKMNKTQEEKGHKCLSASYLRKDPSTCFCYHTAYFVLFFPNQTSYTKACNCLNQ